MSSLHLEFPVWVQHKNDKYLLRPLFITEPVGADERYEKAVKNLAQALRKQFSQYQASRRNINHLLWFLWNPALHFEVLDLDF